jgi:hypothetical protein
VLGWKITLIWALGANFNVKLRLVGPWVWEGAKEVLEGECWETVTRRGGFFGNLPHISQKRDRNEFEADSDIYRSCDTFWTAHAGLREY